MNAAIAQYTYSLHARRDFLEEFSPLGCQAVFETHVASRIAPGLRQARDIAVADRIGRNYEHDWDRARGLQNRQHTGSPRSQDDVGCEPYKFRGISSKKIGF